MHHSFQATAFLITAHNDLLVVGSERQDGSEERYSVIRPQTSGLKSILYSSHLCWKNGEELLVASGFVTGEVIVWSASTNPEKSRLTGCQLHYVLRGHEGSVFGVQISHLLDFGTGPIRLLCSCSDDRTICVWDITSADASIPSNDSDPNCVAKAMGHGSRIWSVQFVDKIGETPDLLSFGEDGTAQIWQLIPDGLRKTGDHRANCPPLLMMHKSTYAYHSGGHLRSPMKRTGARY